MVVRNGEFGVPKIISKDSEKKLEIWPNYKNKSKINKFHTNKRQWKAFIFTNTTKITKQKLPPSHLGVGNCWLVGVSRKCKRKNEIHEQNVNLDKRLFDKLECKISS